VSNPASELAASELTIAELPAFLVREEQLQPIVEEYAARLQAGEAPDPYELLVLHLPLARELEERLRLVELLHANRPAAPADGQAGPPVGASLVQRPTDLPATIGRYQIRRRLGAGWSAVVYQAWDPHLRREVALKVLREEISRDRFTVERFKREAPIVARLRHPHIVPLHESGESDGRRYLDTELVAGESLQERLLRHPRQELRQAAQLVLKLATALDYAHAQGVVHRDVKPSNILIDAQGEPQLTDFGLASCNAAFETLTADGQLLGTPPYMSPEQVAGDRQAVDRRSDVYSLGVVLYKLLTGRLPFEPGESYAALVYDIAHRDPPRPRAIRSAIPTVLQAICCKTLEKSPGDRFQSAAELADELRRWLNDEPSQLSRPSWLSPLRRWARRNRATAWTLGIAVAVVGLALGVAGWSRWQQNMHAQGEARAQLITLHDAVRQKLRQPHSQRRTEVRELLEQVRSQRRLLPPGPDVERLDLQSRSLFAWMLATPELVTRERAELHGLWNRHWPTAIHPDGRSMAIGTTARPILWRRGETLTLPEGLTEPLPGSRVVFSPAGDWLLCAPDDGGLQVWDAAVTRILGELPREGTDAAAILALGFAPQSRVAVGLTDGRAHIYSLPALAPCESWPLASSGAAWSAAAFNQDATRLVRGDAQGQVQVVDAAGGQLPQWRADASQIQALAWLPGDKAVAVGSKGGAVRLWDLATRQPSASLYVGSIGVGSIAFTPDGRWLLASQRGTPIRVWDVAAERLLMCGSGPFSNGLARDGSLLATGSMEDVTFAELAPPQIIREFSGHARGVQQIVWSADSRRFATIDTGFAVRVWEPGSPVPVYSIAAPAENFFAHHSNAGLALSPDGRLLAFASGGDKESHLFVRDIALGELLWSGTLGGGHEHLVAVGDNEFLLAREQRDPDSNTSQTVLYRWQAGHEPALQPVLRRGRPGEKGFFDGELSRDGRHFIWAGPREPWSDQRLEIWDVATGNVRMLRRSPDGERVETTFCLSPDARVLNVSTGVDERQSIDLQTGASTPLAGGPIAASPGGQWLMLQRPANVFHLCRRGQEQKPWLEFAMGGDDPLSFSIAVAFSPDGRYLSWGTEFGGLRVADLAALESQVAAFESGGAVLGGR